MSDKDRIDRLTIMVAKLIQLEIYERRQKGSFGYPGVFTTLLEMQEYMESEDCVKNSPSEVRL